MGGNFGYYDSEARAKNGSGGWKNVTDGKLTANKGYIFQCDTQGSIEITISKPSFDKSNKKVSLEVYAESTTEAQDASWNFIGNPNLSYYDLTDLKDNYESPITVWNSSSKTYDAIMPGDDDYEFHPFEAFFVQKPSDKDDIEFDNDKRRTYNEAQKQHNARIREREKQTVDESRLIVNLAISDGSLTDKTRVVFNDLHTTDYETSCDASKFLSPESVPQLYTLDANNIRYAINERSNIDRTVRLGFSAPADGEYSISAPRMDCAMALWDTETGAIHDFADGAYEFTAKSGSNDSRFMLVSAGAATGIETLQTEPGIEAVSGGIVLDVTNGQTVRVYSAQGQMVEQTAKSGKIALPAGVYVVTKGNQAAKVLVE